MAIRTDTSDSRVVGVFTTPSLMSLLGGRAELGRIFVAADSERGAPPVAILSYDFWRSHFGADSGVIGRSIELQHRVCTIVGVMPRDMTFPSYAQVWIARSAAGVLADSSRYALQALARLSPGATPARAGAELTVIARSDSLASHQHGPLPTIGAAPFRDFLIDQFGGPLKVLAAIGIAIGIIAAVNFAALVLARGHTSTRRAWHPRGARRVDVSTRDSHARRVHAARGRRWHGGSAGRPGGHSRSGRASAGSDTPVAASPTGLCRGAGRDCACRCDRCAVRHGARY